jgi:hypothetical protein
MAGEILVLRVDFGIILGFTYSVCSHFIVMFF